jgi:hypothetical protein
MSQVSGTIGPGSAGIAAQKRVIAVLERLPALANAKPALVRRGRHLSADLVISIGDRPCFLPISNGSLGAVECRPQVMRSSRFSLRAAAETWETFWRPFPPPGHHDIFALMKSGKLGIEGDVHLLMCHLQYIKDLLALPRQLPGAGR